MVAQQVSHQGNILSLKSNGDQLFQKCYLTRSKISKNQIKFESINQGQLSSDGNKLKHLPLDTTHLFISSGGNDALEAAYLLSEKVTHAFESMSVISNVIETFQDQYREMLRLANSQIKNVVVYTIYDSITFRGEFSPVLITTESTP